MRSIVLKRLEKFWNNTENSVSNLNCDDQTVAQKGVLAFTLRAALFWNNGPHVHSFVQQDGIFYHHNSLSAGERLFAFLEAVGVFIVSGRRGHKLAIRADALEGYANHLIDRGVRFEEVIRALVLLGGDGWLPTSQGPFEPKFYDNNDGTFCFDIRPLLQNLVKLGYARVVGNQYEWTPKMASVMTEEGCWPAEV